MATPLSEVYDILNVFKSQNVVFANQDIPFSFCKVGVIQASIALKKDFPMYTETDINGNSMTYIEGINPKEVYLAGLYAYRNFAMQTHDELKRSAINFKTISFAVSGLTERAKEVMRSVWWCDEEIRKTLNSLLESSGHANEMGEFDE